MEGVEYQYSLDLLPAPIYMDEANYRVFGVMDYLD
jgi:hypothetical protein